MSFNTHCYNLINELQQLQWGGERCRCDAPTMHHQLSPYLVLCLHIRRRTWHASKRLPGHSEELLSCMAERTCASFYQGCEGGSFHSPSSFPNNTEQRNPSWAGGEEAPMGWGEEAAVGERWERETMERQTKNRFPQRLKGIVSHAAATLISFLAGSETIRSMPLLCLCGKHVVGNPGNWSQLRHSPSHGSEEKPRNCYFYAFVQDRTF